MSSVALPDTPTTGAGAPSVTGALAGFVANVRFEDIPASVVHATKRLILDEIVVTAAACETDVARALFALKGDQGGAAEASLIVDGRRVPAPSATYVHAQLANLLDADETMLNRMHTVCASAMAGLAMAEKTSASGRELITAVAAGYDITARVGLSLKQFVPDDEGGLIFAPLFGYGWMALGAAATSARLLGLPPLETARALGQAHVTSPVSFDVVGHHRHFWTDGARAHWHKYQLGGAAAEAGVNAAILASHGWVGESEVLDEGSPFWRSYGALDCEWDVLRDGIGTRWHVEQCALKPYPFCRFGHAALDLFSDMVRDQQLTPGDIVDMLVRVAPLELSETLLKLTVVDEGLKLLWSEPTALALVAHGIPPGPRWYHADLTDRSIRDVARRIRYEVNRDWGPMLVEQQQGDGHFRRLPAEVTVWTRSGAVLTAFTEYAVGDPWAPGFAMTDQQLAEKARGYLAGILPAERIEALIDATMRLDEAPDVRAVAAAMVC